MEGRNKKGKSAVAEDPEPYHSLKACVVTDSPALVEQLARRLGRKHIKVKGSLADVIGEKECRVLIVDTKVSDMALWPAPVVMEPAGSSRSWLFLIASAADASLVSNPPTDSIFFERNAQAPARVAAHLQNQLDPVSGRRIQRVDYIGKERVFIVRLQSGRVYPLKLSDLRGRDATAVASWSVSPDRYYFEVQQESGNQFVVPWDVVLYHCEPAYEYYKGRQGQPPETDRAARIGQKVRARRIKQGLSIAELARRSGMKRPNLSRLEHAQHVPSLETLERVAGALGVPVAELVAEKTE